MLDEKSVEQSSRIAKELISEGKIVKPKPQTLEFFSKQSQKHSWWLKDFWNSK